MSPKPTLMDPVLGPLTDDLLTPDVRVYQRARGHRFSSDDVATAFAAFEACPGARRILDLGCGLGSVLLLLAWKLPEAELVGVEAQEMSFELLRRNVSRSGFEQRISIHQGDLREPEIIARLGGRFELITGTPPYFPPDAAVDAEDAQRAYARIEYRGGVEAYLETASLLVAPGGTIVICGDAHADHRVEASCATLGLAIASRLEVFPRAGAEPLFSVWVILARNMEVRARQERHFTLRDANAQPTEDAQKLRVFSGFPARPGSG